MAGQSKACLVDGQARFRDDDLLKDNQLKSPLGKLLHNCQYERLDSWARRRTFADYKAAKVDAYAKQVFAVPPLPENHP